VYYLFDFDYSVGFNFYIGKLYMMSLVLQANFWICFTRPVWTGCFAGVPRSSRGEAPNTPVIKKKKKKVFILLTLKSEFLLISKNQIPLLAFKSMLNENFSFHLYPPNFSTLSIRSLTPVLSLPSFTSFSSLNWPRPWRLVYGHGSSSTAPALWPWRLSHCHPPWAWRFHSSHEA